MLWRWDPKSKRGKGQPRTACPLMLGLNPTYLLFNVSSGLQEIFSAEDAEYGTVKGGET
jgi:hypothetical protein